MAADEETVRSHYRHALVISLPIFLFPINRENSTNLKSFGDIIVFPEDQGLDTFGIWKVDADSCQRADMVLQNVECLGVRSKIDGILLFLPSPQNIEGPPTIVTQIFSFRVEKDEMS